MRIATWNLERGGRTTAAGTAQRETLQELGADVVVLTEPPDSFERGPGVVTSPAHPLGTRGPGAWVAIVGPHVEPVPVELPYERLAAAARVGIAGRNVIFYGTVLPWLAVRSHAPELVRPGEAFVDVFKRALEEQQSDLLNLQRGGALVVWAGDFNQSVDGPNHGGSREGREALNRCLADLGFAAWNGRARHAHEGLFAIDLICGNKDQAILEQGRIDPIRGGVRMSHHAGYWVDI